MAKLTLNTEDLAVLSDFKAKNISINALSDAFSRVNQKNITPQEKYYLKKILVDNINKSYARQNVC